MDQKPWAPEHDQIKSEQGISMKRQAKKATSETSKGHVEKSVICKGKSAEGQQTSTKIPSQKVGKERHTNATWSHPPSSQAKLFVVYQIGLVQFQYYFNILCHMSESISFRWVGQQSDKWLHKLEDLLRSTPHAGVGEVSISWLEHEQRWGLSSQVVSRGGHERDYFYMHPIIWPFSHKYNANNIIWHLSLSQASNLCLQCGLDKLRKNVDFSAQEEIFRAQLKLAKELARPVSVRERWHGRM